MYFVENSLKTNPISIFVLFVIVQALFGLIYYLTYTANPNLFAFNDDVYRAQELAHAHKLEEEKIELSNAQNELSHHASSQQEEQKLWDNPLSYLRENANDENLQKNISQQHPFLANEHIYQYSQYLAGEGRAQYLESQIVVFSTNGEFLYHLQRVSLAGKLNNQGIDGIARRIKEELERDIKPYKQRVALLDDQVTTHQHLISNRKVFGYLDFFYFGFTFVGNSDILPNSPIIRITVVLQHMIEVYILIFMVLNISKQHQAQPI